MLWIINHVISYTYSKPVTLECHTIKLRPKSDSRQNLQTYNLLIDPKPAFLTNYNDVENNSLTMVWFEGQHIELRIHAISKVHITNYNPFNFILTKPATINLPVSYDAEDLLSLRQYINQKLSKNKAVSDFIQPIINDSKEETMQFLFGLAKYIYEHFKKTNRRLGNPKNPEGTISYHKGACRDLAWLYVVACRTVGLAARFVSGYIAPFNPRRRPALHAWAEVFLPGAGWTAFDPSYGIAITERHISVTASYNSVNTLPISGTYRGDAISKMNVHVSLKKSEE